MKKFCWEFFNLDHQNSFEFKILSKNYLSILLFRSCKQKTSEQSTQTSFFLNPSSPLPSIPTAKCQSSSIPDARCQSSDVLLPPPEQPQQIPCCRATPQVARVKSQRWSKAAAVPIIPEIGEFIPLSKVGDTRRYIFCLPQGTPTQLNFYLQNITKRRIKYT